MLKKKNNIASYEMKTTSIEGYSGRDYEEKLEQFKKELEKKGGYIHGTITVRSIVIYQEKMKEGLVEKVEE